MNKKKYIGIMVANRLQRKRVLQTYLKYVPKGIKLFSFMPSSIRWKQKRILGLHYINKKFRIKSFPIPPVIYNRYYRAENRTFQRLKKEMGHFRGFNDVTQFNKLHLYHLFLGSDFIHFIPVTLPYQEGQLHHLLDQYKVLYLKPSIGNRGKGVFRMERTETGAIHLSQHYFSPIKIANDPTVMENEINNLMGSRPYIVQQGVTFRQINGHNFDIRVLVQKNGTGRWTMTNMVSRIAYSGCFNTSMCEKVLPSEEILYHLYSPDRTQEMLQIIQDISIQVAACIENNGGYHLGEIGIDFGIDDNDLLWMIEINGQPQKNIYKKHRTVQKVYENPIQYARFLL